MQITEVRIKLMEESSERLQAFCSITFDDCFVVRDLKIIEGSSGPFVAMPSRKLTSHCPHCGCKNHLRAAHCNQCGSRLKDDRAIKDADGRAKLYADIAHPINSSCREMIQQRVIEEFRLEQVRAKQPGYVSRYDDFDIDVDDLEAAQQRREPATVPSQTHAAHQPGPPHRMPTPSHAPPQQRPNSSQRIPAPHPPRRSSDAPRDNSGPTSSGGANNAADANDGFGAGIF